MALKLFNDELDEPNAQLNILPNAELNVDPNFQQNTEPNVKINVKLLALKLAIKSDKISIANFNLFDFIETLDINTLNDLMEIALKYNRHDFVEFLIENYLDLVQFLTKDRLIKLFDLKQNVLMKLNIINFNIYIYLF